MSTKVHLVKAMVFPVVMYGCESWTVKKTEHRRIAAFELWCWRRLLRVPWRSDQPILKGISPGCPLEGLMLKLKLQSFGHLIAKSQLIWKYPDAGKDWGQEEKGTTEDEMVALTQWTSSWVNSRNWWWTGRPGVLQSMGSQSQTQLSGWTELTDLQYPYHSLSSGQIQGGNTAPPINRKLD